VLSSISRNAFLPLCLFAGLGCSPAQEASPLAVQVEAPALVATPDSVNDSEGSPSLVAAGVASGTGIGGEAPNGPDPTNMPTSAPASRPEDAAQSGLSPIELMSLLESAGWTRESPANLIDHLPVPLGAEGEVARFSDDAGAQTWIVAVTYPEAEFAAPHVGWVEERRRLMPSAHERVVQQDATVIHIRAETADALAAAAELIDSLLQRRAE
jgi:hypothetical protein